MAKGKKWTLRLLGVAALALLICLCLLGSTMARYTSKGEGSGSLTVALWQLESVDLDTPGDAFSPSADEYTEGRSNTSAWLDAFQMQNDSAVAADVTFELATTTVDDEEVPEVTLNWDSDFAWGTGWTGDSYTEDGDGNPTGKAQTNAYGADIMGKFGFTESSEEEEFEALVNSYVIFSLEFGSGTSTEDATKLDGPLNIEAGSTADVYCEVVWTSVYDENYATTYTSNTFDTAAEFSDAIDTIIGMYVKSISFKVTWTAVQASTLPQG